MNCVLHVHRRSAVRVSRRAASVVPELAPGVCRRADRARRYESRGPLAAECGGAGSAPELPAGWRVTGPRAEGRPGPVRVVAALESQVAAPGPFRSAGGAGGTAASPPGSGRHLRVIAGRDPPTSAKPQYGILGIPPAKRCVCLPERAVRAGFG